MKAFTLIGLSALPGLIWTSSTLMVTDKIAQPVDGQADTSRLTPGPIHQQFAAADDAATAYRLSALAVSEKDPVGYDLIILLQHQCAHAAGPVANDRWAQAQLKQYCQSLTRIEQPPPMKATSALLTATLYESESQLGCDQAMQMASIIAGVSPNPFEVRSAVRYLASGRCPGLVNNPLTAWLAAELAFCEVSDFCQPDSPYTLYVCSTRSSCSPGLGLAQILSSNSPPGTYARASILWKTLRQPDPETG